MTGKVPGHTSTGQRCEVREPVAHAGNDTHDDAEGLAGAGRARPEAHRTQEGLWFGADAGAVICLSKGELRDGKEPIAIATLVRAAARVGISVPVNRVLLALLARLDPASRA